MAPFLPIMSITGQQQLRVGRGAGSSLPSSLKQFDQATSPQSGALKYAFYADLAQPEVRRDLQRHSAIGAWVAVAGFDNTHFSDLIAPSGLAVSGVSSSFNVQTSAGTLESRTFNFSGEDQIAVAANTAIPISGPIGGGNRIDLVYINAAGVIGVAPGASTVVVNDVDTIAYSGTGATINFTFTFSGYIWKTAALTVSGATTTTVQTAFNGSTVVGPSLLGSTTIGTLLGNPFTVTGTVPTAIVVTFAGGPVGPYTLAPGQTGTFTDVPSATGAGPNIPQFGGAVTPLALVAVPSSATTSSNYTITNVVATS